jgi:hypothetical protein
MVNSSGKLYHHKIKLIRLQWDSDTDETLEYIKKRHPLYFTTEKMLDDQIVDLIKRLKYKLKLIAEKEGKVLSTADKVQSIKSQHDKNALSNPAMIKTSTAQPTTSKHAPVQTAEPQKKTSLLGDLPTFSKGGALPSVSGANKENNN